MINNSCEFIMRSNEQGALVECVYCKLIEPKYKGTKQCPICHGNTPRFQPLRMMDRYTSGQDILNQIINTEWDREPKKLRDQLISLLNMVDIYHFDLKEALIDKIKNLFEVN